tara:strand:+ start:6337 stop:6786 length:450 start_codon:yes stop_codon:yes gene_type:complete
MNYWLAPGIRGFDIKGHISESLETDIKLVYQNKPSSLLQAILEKSYLNYVIQICEEIFEVDNMFSKSRRRIYTESRFACWYLLRNVLHMSTTKIGLKFNKDHSTIISGTGQHTSLVQFEEDYKYKYFQAKKLLINKMIKDEKNYQHLRD